MKDWIALTTQAVPLWFNGSAAGQSGSMTEGGIWGAGWLVGLGGVWIPILLVLAVLGGVAWVILTNRK